MNQASSAIRKFHLMDQYRTFTHGGNYWRDNYRLNYWDECVQPVVHRNNIYNGYKLLRMLGDWGWLTRDPKRRYGGPLTLLLNLHLN